MIGLSVVAKDGTLKTPASRSNPGLIVVGKDGTVRLAVATGIEDGSVTEAKIAPGAVTESKIRAGAITQEHLQAGIVGADQLGHSINAVGIGFNADMVDGQHATEFAGAIHDHEGSYAPLSHDHDGTEITTGKVNNLRLNTGAGNGLDADKVDGQHASAFAPNAHNHDAAHLTTGKINNARLNAGSSGGIDADSVDGKHATAFAGAGHNHDAAYAPTGHDHDADYALATHLHDGSHITTGKIANARLNTGTGNGLDADKVDGYHATITPTANAICVMNADGRLPGHITGNAHTVDWIHANATPTANQLLPLNADKKLPASITGDADTVDGKHANELGGASITPYRQLSIQEYTTTNTTLHDLPGCYLDIEVQTGDIVVMWATFRHAISSARGAAVKYKARIGETYSVTQEVGNAFSNSFIGAAVNLVDTITAGGTIRVGVQFAGCSTTQTVYARDMELSILVIK